MPVKQAQKRIYYFRSISSSNQPVDIQKPLTVALKSHPTIADTEINFVDEVVRIQRYGTKNKRLFLHFVEYAPGEKNSTLTPKIKKTNDTEVGHAPPAGKEYKKGECFLVIVGCNILFCSNGLTHQKADLYIHKLFQASGIKFEAFRFKAASNLDKVKLLQAQGVKSVKLNVSAYKLSLTPKTANTWIKKTFASMSAEFSAIAGKDQTRSEQKALEDMVVSIEVGLDGNNRATEDAKDTLTDFATEVLDNDLANFDSFVIMTRDNTPITPDSIRLHSDFKVSKSDTSIDTGETWRAMDKYLDSLATENLLEQ